MDKKPEFKDEVDFRDLLRKPWKLFGYSYIYFLLILTALGISYMENITVIGKNSVMPTVLVDSSSFVQDIPYESPKSLPPVDVMKVATPTPDLIGKGRDLFRANCSSCHGDDGQGDGPVAITLNPKPRNFHSLAGWTNGSKISQIYKTLQDGVPGTGMASFSYMPPLDRFALIHYARSFATGPVDGASQPTDTPQELEALETTYQLSKGVNTPGQIPVTKAIRIIEREAAPEVANVSELVKDARDPRSGAGLEVFDRVARDKSKIFAGLLYNNTSSLQSIDQFTKAVTANPIQLGFKAEVVQLSSSEWMALYQFISGLKAQRGRS
jgi:mono/diheme cytochrome c family protein